MSNHQRLCIALISAALTVAVTPSSAQITPAAPIVTGAGVQPADPSTELLHSATVRLTRGDYDTQLLRLPPEARGEFGTNIDRINSLLRIMLVDKTLAHEARQSGLERDPAVANKIAAETDRILAQAMIERNQAQWEKDFDARPNIEQAARERWLTQPDKYRSPEQIKVTHILYAVPKHKAAQARAMANAARDKILAGADMSALAKAESDDPSAAENGGHLDWRTAAQLDPSFARAAFSLKKVGDLSPPVESEYGFHVIRLDAREPGAVPPFDKVKAAIIAELRKDYVDTMRSQRMAAIRDDPAIVVNQPAVDALVVRIDPAILKKVIETPPAPGKPAATTPPATAPAAK